MRGELVDKVTLIMHSNLIGLGHGRISSFFADFIKLNLQILGGLKIYPLRVALFVVQLQLCSRHEMIFYANVDNHFDGNMADVMTQKINFYQVCPNLIILMSQVK